MFSFVCFVQVKRLARKIVYYVLSPTQLNHAVVPCSAGTRKVYLGCHWVM